MDSQPEDASRTSPALGGPGPVIFALSLVCAVLLWTRQGLGPAGPGAPRHTAPALPDRAGVEGWIGTSGSLHARLMPLHADKARQAFDGEALQRKLGLGPGEPWRLLVTYIPRGELAESPVPITGWSVVDAEGVALRPIVDGPGPGVDSGVVDPLRSLLSAPDQLEPGFEVSLVFWGRAPVGTESEAPRILGPEDGDVLWELEARRFERSPSQPSLARLERGVPMGRGMRASGPGDRPIGPAAQNPR